jgi:hypothetical protein
MRFTIPSDHVTKVASHGYVQVYKRARNQNAIYLLTFKGETLHIGKRRHISRMFNYYRGAIGRPMEMAYNAS